MSSEKNPHPDKKKCDDSEKHFVDDDENRNNDPMNTHRNEIPPSVVELCKETFQKSAEYVQGELEGTIEDYRLLEKMNKVTVCKYSEMKHIAMNIESALKDLNAKYKGLQPYLEQIDQIEDSVASLEQAAYSLDHYSKRLEAKFRTLEKK